MDYSIDIAQARIAYPNKGEDACCVRCIDEGHWLLAVADGLTMEYGGDAARWAIEHLSATIATESPRAMLKDLKQALTAQAGTRNRSRTTLTAGLLSLIEDEYETRLRFDFFGIGDSPVWCVVRSSDPEFPYQRHSVYGSIYPALSARVYATLRLAEGDVMGKVSFGSVDVGIDEVLVVCSDGVPERSVFARDFQFRSALEPYERLCEWLFRPEPYGDESLSSLLQGYLERGTLSDDASLIAARLRPSGAWSQTSQTLTPEGTPAAISDASREEPGDTTGDPGSSPLSDTALFDAIPEPKIVEPAYAGRQPQGKGDPGQDYGDGNALERANLPDEASLIQVRLGQARVLPPTPETLTPEGKPAAISDASSDVNPGPEPSEPVNAERESQEWRDHSQDDGNDNA